MTKLAESLDPERLVQVRTDALKHATDTIVSGGGGGSPDFVLKAAKLYEGWLLRDDD